MPSCEIYHKRRKKNKDKDMWYKPNPCKKEYTRQTHYKI